MGIQSGTVETDFPFCKLTYPSSFGFQKNVFFLGVNEKVVSIPRSVKTREVCMQTREDTLQAGEAWRKWAKLMSFCSSCYDIWSHCSSRDQWCQRSSWIVNQNFRFRSAPLPCFSDVIYVPQWSAMKWNQTHQESGWGTKQLLCFLTFLLLSWQTEPRQERSDAVHACGEGFFFVQRFSSKRQSESVTKRQNLLLLQVA